MMRPCLGSTHNEYAHTLTDNRNGRCSDCNRQRETTRTRGKRARRPYTNTERAEREAIVATWRAEHGDWCPGWGRPAHPSQDLTADHVVAVAAGGDEHGPMSVLCRTCNGRKGTQPDIPVG